MATVTQGREARERVAGCEVNLLRGGSGEPLLYLHGAGGGGQWMPFMEALAQNFEVIAPEHPGYGRSDMPAWLDNIGDLAYFYLDFIARLGLGRVHLVGHSLGGWIAAELAVRDQHPLRTLTLVAPGGIHVKGVAPGDIFLWSTQQRIRNLFFNPAFAEAMLAQPLGEQEQELLLKNQITTARLGWQPRLHNPDLAKWLHRITVPTLLLWGDSDKIIPPLYGPTFRNLIPGSRLSIIPQCGHLPQVEKTEEYVAAVTGFIRGERA